jgi:hypothetical protein
LHIVQAVWGINSEAKEKNGSIWITKRDKPCIVFLPSRVPEVGLNLTPINFIFRNVIFEDSGHVDLATLAIGLSSWNRNSLQGIDSW